MILNTDRKQSATHAILESIIKLITCEKRFITTNYTIIKTTITIRYICVTGHDRLQFRSSDRTISNGPANICRNGRRILLGAWLCIHCTHGILH